MSEPNFLTPLKCYWLVQNIREIFILIKVFSVIPCNFRLFASKQNILQFSLCHLKICHFGLIRPFLAHLSNGYLRSLKEKIFFQKPGSVISSFRSLPSFMCKITKIIKSSQAEISIKLYQKCFGFTQQILAISYL